MAANWLHYGSRTVQYLQKRTKRLEISKLSTFFFHFLAANRAHKEGHYDEDTSQHNNDLFA